MRWTGPRDEDWADSTETRLRAPVPPERWPYGPPDAHDDWCMLFGRAPSVNAILFCDCSASASED